MKSQKIPVQVESTTLPTEEPGKGQLFLSSAAQAKLLWGFLALYVLLVFYGILNHELWRDEGLDWMAVRDLSFKDLIGWYVPQGGHPPLYYIILFPLAKLGLPLKTVNVVSLVFMTASLYIILFKTKFPLLFKLALVFSYFFFYEYGVIGRNYAVVVFFGVLVLSHYPRRFERPWLFALALVCLLNSDSYLFPFSMMMVGMYWLELWQQKKLQLRYIFPASFMAIGGLYILPYLALPGIKSQSHIVKIPDHFLEITKTIGRALVLDNYGLVIVLVFIAILAMLIARPKAFLLLLGGAVGMLYLMAYVRVGELRHSGLLLVEIIIAYGIGTYYEGEDIGILKNFVGDGKKMMSVGLVIISCCLVFQSFAGLRIWKQDIDNNFSGGKDAADFIMDNNLEHKIIIGHTSWAASAVLQYLPKDCKMYYADCQRYGTFIIYDSLYEANQFRFSENYGPVIAEKNFHDSLDKVLLVLNKPLISKKFKANWTMIYSTADEPMKKQESYFMYVIKRSPRDTTRVKDTTLKDVPEEVDIPGKGKWIIRH